MITIGQLAAYAGVTIKAIRHYHRRGLLAEPPRDASGYRRYSAQHAIALVKIKTLAAADVPLGRPANRGPSTATGEGGINARYPGSRAPPRPAGAGGRPRGTRALERPPARRRALIGAPRGSVGVGVEAAQREGTSMTIRIATISIILALVVPLPLLAMAWLYWGSWQAGVIAALGALLVFVGVALVAFSRVRELSWLAVALPYTVGMAYTVLPDAVPLLPADDVLMTGIMGLLSFGLALRKNPATPKWPIIPLLGAAAYPLLGALVPLPIDEFVVQFLLGTLALKGVREHWAPHRVPTGARKALGRSTDG